MCRSMITVSSACPFWRSVLSPTQSPDSTSEIAYSPWQCSTRLSSESVRCYGMSSNPTTTITTDTNGDMSSSAPIAASSFPAVIELNVGGVFYTTSLVTLTQDPDSLLGQMFTGRSKTAIARDSKGKYFVDRDGVLFRYVLDYLRNRKLVLPEGFHERRRLRQEAEYFGLDAMVEEMGGGESSGLQSAMSLLTATAKGTGYLSPSEVAGKPGYVTIGYRGSFAFGRDGLADVKFRKLSRILICGRITLCREVFGDTLNESRDPDRGCVDRYTSRFFLKHTFLEQAFDMLLEAGFRCVAAAGSGTSGGSGVDMKPGMDSEESRWNHYNEFVFARLPQF